MDGSNVSGATGKTFVPLVGHIGDPVTVDVTATNGAGATTVTSYPTANVIGA